MEQSKPLGTMPEMGGEGKPIGPSDPEAVEVLRNAGIIQRMLLGISGPCDTGRSDPARSRPCLGSSGLGIPGSVSGGDVEGLFVATLPPGAPAVGNLNGPMLQSLGRQVGRISKAFTRR